MSAARLGVAVTEEDDVLRYRFSGEGADLDVVTDRPDRDDPSRVLSLGPQQSAILEWMVRNRQAIAGKRVFDVFAGSGVFGLMALKLGAAHVDFLDISPRAIAFQRRNAERNGFEPARMSLHRGDAFEFRPQGRYELILANPPFVPVPNGIGGTLTSHGGPDGNRFVHPLVEIIRDGLTEDGEALAYVYQFTAGGAPLIGGILGDAFPRREVRSYPAQTAPSSLSDVLAAYETAHPGARAEIRAWGEAMMRDHRAEGASHIIAKLGPETGRGETLRMSREDFARDFGADFLLPADHEDIIPVDGRRR